MSRIVSSFLLLIGFVSSHAQIIQPAKLTPSPVPTQGKAGETIELVFTATIDRTWHLYTVGFDGDCGPIPLKLGFENQKGFELVGGLVAVGDQSKHDEIFDCEVKIFETKGEFRQKIRLLQGNVNIQGTYEGQACSDRDGKCVLVDGVFSLGPIVVLGEVSGKQPIDKGKKSLGQAPFVNQVPPITSNSMDTATAQVSQPMTGEIKGPTLDPSFLEGDAPIEMETFWGFIVLAFVLGLASLVTPCVFPMVPMTVTFFLREGQSRKEGIKKAIFFGTFIIAIYTVAGTLFAMTLGADGLNAIATHWLPNLFVFAVFLAFAFSFLGMYEINAPTGLVNSADRAAEKGGLAGVFFMASTLVLVSFSCTIPIVGNVLVLSSGGQFIKPVLGMFSYALAFAIPFTLFAIFPEWMKGLPKSGGWLNSVKVTLGLLELALSVKFFSIADQAYHWGLLDREVNIAFWIVVFSILGFYFLGKIKFPHDSKVEHVGVPRLLMAVLAFSFVVYLVPGLFGAPLKALAGYLPPMHTHDFNLMSLQNQKGLEGCEEPKYADFLHLPHGLSGYFDYGQALACARKQNKPLFIDFTGHGCTNCREMEAVVWSDPRVLERLRNDYVVVALYVDDRTPLPESEWAKGHHGGVIKTLGKKNAELQISNLNNNAQPFYVLVGEDERVLAWPRDYDRDAEHFIQFLDEGKRKYKETYP